MRSALLVLAGAGLLGSIGYLIEALRYPMGTVARSGPGFYPLLVGVVLMLGFIGMGVEAAMSQRNEQVSWPRGEGRWRVAAITVASLGYIALLPTLGHPVAGALVVFVVLQVMQLRSWPLKIILALGFGFGSHYLFSVALGVPLPAGIWLG